MDLPTLSRDALYAKWKHIFDQVEETCWSWTGGHECAFLAEMALKASSIVEIGSYHGRSAKMMALASNPPASIYCIDNFENVGCEEIFRVNLSEEIKSGQVKVFRGTSDLIVEFDPAIKFDYAFIDAGHLEPDLTKDIKNVMPRMAPGGIISGHDWRSGNPMDGVNVSVEKAFNKNDIKVFESIWYVKLP